MHKWYKCKNSPRVDPCASSYLTAFILESMPLLLAYWDLFKKISMSLLAGPRIPVCLSFPYKISRETQSNAFRRSRNLGQCKDFANIIICSWNNVQNSLWGGGMFLKIVSCFMSYIMFFQDCQKSILNKTFKNFCEASQNRDWVIVIKTSLISFFCELEWFWRGYSFQVRCHLQMRTRRSIAGRVQGWQLLIEGGKQKCCHGRQLCLS